VALREPIHRVSPRARLAWATEGALKGLVLIAVLVLLTEIWNVFPMPWWGWVLVALAVIVFTWAHPTLRYAIHRWEVGTSAVYTQSGWITRERRVAPLNRVQTVDFEQHPIARVLGLATVTITTASAAGPLKIAGLDRGVAEDLVAELTRRTATEPGDAT
jgi:membrane protein YdbS with pleckstrin-like domain